MLSGIEKAVSDKVQKTYQTIHQHPELSMQEYETGALIRKELEAAGFTEFVDAESLETEVIAVLRTGKPGKTTCLRAELDALGGTTERTGLPYSSTVEGVMHACGHDAHAAMLLGAALLLKDDPDLTGTIVFLWQPAEEKAGGADDIVDERVLHKLGVERVFAQHVAGGVEVGNIEFKSGPLLAGSNYFWGEITGNGSHGAYPHSGDDIPVTLGEIAAGLPTLPARQMNVVKEPCIITVAWLECGEERTLNKIPSSGSFGGTIRAFFDIDKELSNGKSITSIVTKYVMKTAQARNCNATLEIVRGAPPTVNNEALAASILPYLNQNWEHGSILESSRRMVAEDFAYYTKDFPSLFFKLGIAKDSLGWQTVHRDDFTIHPDALDIGVELLVLLAHAD